MSNQSRPFSIVSAHTDFELCAVAELLSPAVSHARSVAEEQEAMGVALDDGLDDYLDASIKRCDQGQRKPSMIPHLLLECEEPFSPPHPSYSPASGTFTPSESESESPPEDDHWHPHAPSAFPTFHLPRRARARKQSSAGVSTSDSDTPSLSSSTTSISSSHSRSYSPPMSPATLKTPVDHVSPPHTLAIIEERVTGNRVPIDRHGSHNSGSMIFAPMELPSGLDGLGQSPRWMENRTKNRNIENLRVNVPPPSVPFPILTHSPSPTLEPSPSVTMNRSAVPSPRPGLRSLTRIISPVSKTSRSFELASESLTSPTISVSTSKSSKEDAKEAKMRKAEAKRMKKAEQQAKVERLAEELKERKRRQALAQDRSSVHSNPSAGRAQPHSHWDGHKAMYGGLENVV